MRMNTRLNLSSNFMVGLPQGADAALAGRLAASAAARTGGGSLGLYFSGNRIGSHSGWADRLATSDWRNAGSRALPRQRCISERRTDGSALSHTSTSA